MNYILLTTEDGFELYDKENLEKIYSYKGIGKFYQFKNKIFCFEDEKLKVVSASGKLEKIISYIYQYI